MTKFQFSTKFLLGSKMISAFDSISGCGKQEKIIVFWSENSWSVEGSFLVCPKMIFKGELPSTKRTSNLGLSLQAVEAPIKMESEILRRVWFHSFALSWVIFNGL